MGMVKRRTELLCIMVFTFIMICQNGHAFAGESAVDKGMDLLRMHRYEDAIGMLRSNIKKGLVKRMSEANLALGMAYLRNAQLHRELYNTSLTVYEEYLQELAKVRGKAKSTYVNLYFGETLLAMKKPKKARIYLNKFIADKRAGTKYKNLARAGLGYSYFLQGNKKKAESVWAGIRTKDAEVLTRLALYYIKAGSLNKKPVEECKRILSRSGSMQKGLSAQAAMNVIGVYARAGLIEEGMGVREDIDLKTFSYEESFGKNKKIRFYDITLLDSLAELFGKAALEHLEKAQTDKKTRDSALYYSEQTFELLGDNNRAAELTSTLLSSKKVPEPLRDQLQVRKVYLHNLVNGKKSTDPFKELFSGRTPKPDMLAEILISCGKLNIECTDAVLQATSLVEKKGGKAVWRVNYALGLYYLNKQDFDRSVLYMEAGRDKSNKNSIAHNGPLMLEDIADANFMAKQYSEALEILFALSEQFPQIRQIQVAMQGIYMREQKSAGDVKIF